jgi:hypothetical protein
MFLADKLLLLSCENIYIYIFFTNRCVILFILFKSFSRVKIRWNISWASHRAASSFYATRPKWAIISGEISHFFFFSFFIFCAYRVPSVRLFVHLSPIPLGSFIDISSYVDKLREFEASSERKKKKIFFVCCLFFPLEPTKRRKWQFHILYLAGYF